MNRRGRQAVRIMAVVLVVALTLVAGIEMSPTPPPQDGTTTSSDVYVPPDGSYTLPDQQASADRCALSFPLTGGVTVTGEARPLNLTALSCKRRPYENIVHYLEEGARFYERSAGFYEDLGADLVLLEQVLRSHCSVCEEARSTFQEKGYPDCGGGLADAVNGTVDPSTCARVANDTCGGGTPPPDAGQGPCPLCGDTPKRSGSLCKTGSRSLPIPMNVLECARLARAVSDACVLGASARPCEMAERVSLLQGYLTGTLLPLLPQLVTSMSAMVEKLRTATTNGTAPQSLAEDLERLDGLLNATFTSSDHNISSFQSELRSVLASLADPRVISDIGRGEGPVTGAGIALGGDDDWDDLCQRYAAGPCFGQEPVPEAEPYAQEMGGVCANPSQEACDQRAPDCEWQDGKCMPSCRAWLSSRGLQSNGTGCNDQACSGQGGQGVAYDCQYCCAASQNGTTNTTTRRRPGKKTPAQEGLDWIPTAFGPPAGVFDEDHWAYDWLPTAFGPPMGFFKWLAGEPEDIIDIIPGTSLPGMPGGIDPLDLGSSLLGDIPWECGGCHTQHSSITIDIPNLDAYDMAAVKVVAMLAVASMGELFVGDGACLAYATPRLDCSSVCRRCHGSSTSHCHAQAGLCVCEAGLEWSLTRAPCEPLDQREGRNALACCARTFNVTMPLNWTRPPFDLTQECIAPGNSLPAPYVERCQTTSSETGLCCYDGFEETGITAACLALGPTCEIVCLEQFASNATLQERCVERCHVAPVDKETDDPVIRACREGCRRDNDTEVCERMCFALAPDLVVEPTVMRGGLAVRALYTDEMVRAGINVRNRGLLPVNDTVSFDLLLQENCTCPPCEPRKRCDCSCEERTYPVLANLTLGVLLPDTARVLMSRPFLIPSELLNATLFPASEVRGEGTVLGQGRGPLCSVFAMDNITVLDVYFTGPDGGRTTRAYPGTEVTGVIALATTVFPLGGPVLALDGERPVAVSITNVSVAGPGAFLLETESFTVTDDMAGRALALGAQLFRQGHPMLSARFLSQSPVLEECSGDTLTSWCHEHLLYLRPVYPDAYLEVAHPTLMVREAYFTDGRGARTNRFQLAGTAQAFATISNPEPIPFTGELVIRPVDTNGALLEGTSTSSELTLPPDVTTDIATPTFATTTGEHYGLLLSATSSTDVTWLDQIASPALHPFAQLTVGRPIAGRAPGRLATTITVGGCRREVACEECPPTCRFTLDQRTCELVTQNCPCGCVIV